MGTAFLAGQSGVDKSIKRGMIYTTGSGTIATNYGTSADLISITGKGVFKFISLNAGGSNIVAEVSIDGQTYYPVGHEIDNEQVSLVNGGIGNGVILLVEVRFKSSLKIRARMTESGFPNTVNCTVGWIGE